MTPTFTTRAEASAPPTHLVEIQAQAAYERSRFPGSSRPRWEDLEPAYQSEARLDQVAAILAAEAAGYRVVRPDHGSARDQPCADKGPQPCSLQPQHFDGKEPGNDRG